MAHDESLRGKTAIVGVADAVSPTGELEGSTRSLEVRMIREALDDAGLGIGDVDRRRDPVALVDLDDGVRMMSNIVGVEPGSVQVGMVVQVAWEQLSDGRNLPVFDPIPTVEPVPGRNG